MKCPMCGAQNINGTIFCHRCGSELAGQAETAPTIVAPEALAKPEGKIPVGVIVAIAAAATVLMAAFILVTVLLLSRHSALNDRLAAATAASTEASTAVLTTEPTVSSVVTVPNVVGMKATDAVRDLEQLGLRAEKEYEESESVPKDYVIRQSIAADRELSKGDSVMLVVSSGKPAQSSQQSSQSAVQHTPTPKKTFDVASEVAQIRADYYATQDDPGAEKTVNGITYYTKNGETTKIVCPNGTSGWDYSREYFFKNGKLYFAFIFDGTIEHRLYFADDTLIRYIDDDSVACDYGDIQCPFEQKARTEAYQLL